MKTMLGVTAIVLSLVCGASVTFAQSSPGHGIVTGSEANEEENYGYPSPQLYMQQWHHHRAHHSHWR